MSTVPVATTLPSSASPSASSSSALPTSARVVSLSSSAPSTTIGITSSGNQPATPTTSVQATTPSTAIAPNTTQSSALTSSSPATTVVTTTSPTLVSAPTPNTSSTTTSSPSPPTPTPQSSPGRTDIQVTTLLQGTTIFITSTNSQGQVMTSMPPVVTEVITTTGSGGIATTITQAIVNPTLAPNNKTTGSSPFFSNTGAVVGVFVVVGLASASIMMWILFAIRHRQRMRRIEQDTAVEAAVAAAGLNRAPLDDDDEYDSPISPNSRQFTSGMSQQNTLFGHGGSGSLPISTRLSATLDGTIKDSLSSHPGFPAEHRHPDGYLPARTTSPSPQVERCLDDLGSSRDRKSSYGHTPTYSAGSFEPLLANYLQNMPDQDISTPSSQPLQGRSPQHPVRDLPPSGNSFGGSRTSSRRQNSSNGSALRDDEDYTHYVLVVRNIPDNQSQHSV